MLGLKLSRLSTFFVAIIFLAILLSGLLVPIYSDEISFKLMQVGVIENDGKILGIIPQCASGMSIRIPLSWYPGAEIYQFLFQNSSQIFIRFSGVLVYLVTIGMTLLGLRYLNNDRLQFKYIFICTIACLGIGLVPLTLILSRAEQWLLMCLAFFIFSPFLYKSKLTKNIFLSLGLLIYIVFASLFFYTHPKSLLFIPVLVISGYWSFRSNRFFQWVAILFVLFCSFQTLNMAKALYGCEDAPVIALINASQTLNVLGLINQPLVLIKLFFIYISSLPEKIIQYTIFRSVYFVGWLPSLPPGQSLGIAAIKLNQLISLYIYIIFGMGLLLPLVSVVRALSLNKFSCQHAMIAALWVSVIVHMGVYINWNFYAVSVAVFALVLLIFLSVLDISWPKSFNFLGYLLVSITAGLFVMSSFVLLSTLTPLLLDSNKFTYNLRIPGQSLDVPVFNYSTQNDKIRKISDVCKITGDGSRHLVVDDSSFFAFKNMREPMHLAYISDKASGPDIKDSDFLPFLTKMGSPGIVGKCSLFPNSARLIAIEIDGICCLGFNR